MRTALYLIDSARSGIDNMAIDHAMLRQTDRDGVVRIRFYRWVQPTVSLGYFQRYSEFEKFQQRLVKEGDLSNGSESLSVVRRATGGGAIVHHFDWTYSIAMPESFDTKTNSIGASCGLYYKIHKSVVRWLNRTVDRQIHAARLWGAEFSSKDEAGGCGLMKKAPEVLGSSAFLCFLRRSPGDIVVGNHKVMGSAQRRFQSAILQHGSLLLAASPYADELLGLRELRQDLPWDPEQEVEGIQQFANSLLETVAECYQLDLVCMEDEKCFVELDSVFQKQLESHEWTAKM